MPLLLKHIEIHPDRLTVMDFADLGRAGESLQKLGIRYVRDKIVKERMGEQLALHVGRGDLIVDLAWNIASTDILAWCRSHDVLYVSTSLELWDPYEGRDSKPATYNTLYKRHMDLRRIVGSWKNQPGATAILDHGANPGLVSHFTRQALEEIARRWLSEHPEPNERAELIADALSRRAYNDLAHWLDVKAIHISERDSQISTQPRRLGEFVNTWSIEGFFEEGTAPAEIGWGTHERTLPPGAHFHSSGPGNQICLDHFGAQTWVRSWVPSGEILGMAIRHDECFTISERLTVWSESGLVYRPTVLYAYLACDLAMASMHELHMRRYRMQPTQRLMTDEIIEGKDEFGCLLMGHAYKSWWIGSLLDIHESRQLVPNQNATSLQVACAALAAALWAIENPQRGLCFPEDLPHDVILRYAKPYLGPFVSMPVDWSPRANWRPNGERYGDSVPRAEDEWQFGSFLAGLG